MENKNDDQDLMDTVVFNIMLTFSISLGLILASMLISVFGWWVLLVPVALQILKWRTEC